MCSIVSVFTCHNKIISTGQQYCHNHQRVKSGFIFMDHGEFSKPSGQAEWLKWANYQPPIFISWRQVEGHHHSSAGYVLTASFQRQCCYRRNEVWKDWTIFSLDQDLFSGRNSTKIWADLFVHISQAIWEFWGDTCNLTTIAHECKAIVIFKLTNNSNMLKATMAIQDNNLTGQY